MGLKELYFLEISVLCAQLNIPDKPFISVFNQN